MSRKQSIRTPAHWRVWLKSRTQRIAAVSVLLMAVLGIFGGHAPAEAERFEHEHVEIERPIVATTRVIGVDSSGSGGGIALPPLSVRASGMVFPT
jgi:hypothetical protein